MICGLYLYSSKPLSKRYPLSHKLMGGGGDVLVVGALLTTNDDTKTSHAKSSILVPLEELEET
jgi:hypothetical protein